MVLDLTKLYPALFDRNRSRWGQFFKPDGSDSKFEDLVLSSMIAKEKLAKALGFSSVDIPLVDSIDVFDFMSPKNAPLRELLQRLLSAGEFEAQLKLKGKGLLENSTTTGMKMSKALLAEINSSINVKGVILLEVMRKWEYWSKLLPDLPHPSIEKISSKTSCWFGIFIQNLFSSLRSCGKRVGLTLSFFDLINASNHGTFNSCYSLGGTYANSALHHAQHPNIAMMQLLSGDKVAGRAWVWFVPDFTAFTVFPAYGALQQEQIDQLTGNIILRLNKNAGWTKTPRWIKASGGQVKWLDQRKTGAYVYMDGGRTTYINASEAGLSSFTFDLLPDFQYACPKCGMAGQRFREGSIVCDKCTTSMINCSACGAYAMSPDGVAVCSDCRPGGQNIEKCSKCGSFHNKILGCACSTITACAVCASRSKNIRVLSNGVVVCKECFDLFKEDNKCDICAHETQLVPKIITKSSPYSFSRKRIVLALCDNCNTLAAAMAGDQALVPTIAVMLTTKEYDGTKSYNSLRRRIS